jgi:2-dehydro-3-deoxyphosphogalactonate aldolase
VLKAMLAVLPKGTPVLPVGGIGATNMEPWKAAGAAGFGIASALFKPGDLPAAVAERARALRAACG